jgi:hypothetical protein
MGAALRAARVSLNNSSRQGRYWRIYNPTTKKTYYYRDKGGPKSLDDALKRYRGTPRIIKKAVKVDKRFKRKQYRLHFRIDYGPDNGARQGHPFFMRDSYINMSVPLYFSLDEAYEVLHDLFEEAISQEFGVSIGELLDVVSGIEESNDERDEIVINYSYGKSRGGWRSVERTPSRIIEERQRQVRFFKSVGR